MFWLFKKYILFGYHFVVQTTLFGYQFVAHRSSLELVEKHSFMNTKWPTLVNKQFLKHKSYEIFR